MIDPKVHYSHYKPKKSVAFFVTACLTADDGRQTADGLPCSGLSVHAFFNNGRFYHQEKHEWIAHLSVSRPSVVRRPPSTN
ncbi:MAG TPA: hypothetical protein ENJ53_06205 [Phaeodactylibacter sp.]|nr:hypothetical protein [Phaeodactylibacter sp.]